MNARHSLPRPLNKYLADSVGLADHEAPGFGLLEALSPPLFIRFAKKLAKASFCCGLASGEETPPGVVGSGAW